MEAKQPHVLIVDDDPDSREELVHQLVGQGHALEVASDTANALPQLESLRPQVVVVGLGHGKPHALHFLESARKQSGSQAAFIAISRSSHPEALVEAFRHGADHCLAFPEQAEALFMVVRRALEKPALAREVERARAGILDPAGARQLNSILGAHPVMQRLLDKVMAAAHSRATVLIHGETGTGKELVAAAVHSQSKRKDGPFVRLNCSALSQTLLESELFGHEKGAFTGAVMRRKGRFEQADTGTLFLDEVSEIPMPVQVKLLRFLQERQFERVGGNETLSVDARIVAATNKDLRQLVDDGRFREDLYYRLNVVRLEVPPLRARPSDIPLLADHFLRRFAAENDKGLTGFSDEAMNSLLVQPWPGNVRELQNAVEQAVVLCRGDRVEGEHLPLSKVTNDAESIRLMIPGVTLAELERFAILRTLDAVQGSPSRAAAILGISRRTIQYRLQEWGLSRIANSERTKADEPS
ncbi:MAG TPA: sigma-54 dependent transcriptional regulator [Polyangiales bacterium]|nr:sigma-54 dependent transcriptional regulator [Polyangiales bacterium]